MLARIIRAARPHGARSGAALPNEMKAFSNLFGEVFKDGALTVKEKEYICNAMLKSAN